MEPDIEIFGVFEPMADTPEAPAPTTSPRRFRMLKKIMTKAAEVLNGSAALYRELTVSAFSLVSGRRQSA